MNTFLKTFFGSGGSISKPLIALFLLINLIVAYNAIRHDPNIGYDAVEHIKYIEVLSQGRLPTLQENYEFFSPPMPYLVPAAARSAGLSLKASARLFLVLNILWSLMTTFFILAIWHLVQPESISPPRNTLFLLALLPVYYKTCSMVRAEPLFTALTTCVIYLVLRMSLLTNEQDRKKDIFSAIACGAVLGCSMLTRPWTGFLIIALCIYWGLSILKAARPSKLRIVRTAAASVLTAIVISSWFYFHLKNDYGSFTAFNRRGADSFSFSNQSPYFYFGSGNGKLFKDPVRPSFVNQMLPILYSDTWGDYWCYFRVRGFDGLRQTHVAGSRLIPPIPEHIFSNRDAVTAALARNNIMGLLPTVILFIGFVYAILMAIDYVRKSVNISSALPQALCLICLFTFILGLMGYMWFLIMYPHPSEGDTIKASYILHLYPLLCIPAAHMMSRLEEKSRNAYLVLCALLIIILTHNLPSFLTQYTM